MKKLIAFILSLIIGFSFSACGKSTAATETPASGAAAAADPAVTLEPSGGDMIDVDLTRLSSTMVYSEVYAMTLEPERYTGKTVKMKGSCASFTGTTGQLYYACVIQDAMACCAQGLEFELTDGNDYPEPGAEITVVGTFDAYREEYDGNYYLYIILRDAELV